MHTQKIELALPAQLESASFLRDISKDIFKHAGFNQEWEDRLKLVLDELFNNAIRYGSNENGTIHITFFLNEDEVNFLVEDEGKGAKHVSAEELRAKIEKNTHEVEDMTKDSGRGLALIAAFWADELTIKNSLYGGIAIGFKKKIIKKESPWVPQLPIDELFSDEMIQVASIEGGVNAFNFEDKVRPIGEIISALPEKGVLILDCSALEYFNSTFIGQLANWYKEVRMKGGQILMKNTNPETTKILDLVGLKEMIYTRS